MENTQLEDPKNLIISKYIPLLTDNFSIRELKKEDFQYNKNIEESFIIKKGSVLARDKKGNVLTLNEGAPIGFAEILALKPYSLVYSPKEYLEVYAFKASHIKESFFKASSLIRGIIKYSLDRIFKNKKSNTYHLIDDGFLSKQEVKFPMKEYQNADIIFNRDELPKFFFYVETGKVEIISKSGAIVSSFLPGESFGESALFTGTVRSTTAKAVGNTVLQIVSANYIKSYFEDEDTLIKFCLICILERLRAMNNMRNLLV